MAEQPHEELEQLVEFDGYWIPQRFVADDERRQQIRDFALRDDDILITSYPKSGTTWMQAIVSQIVHGGRRAEWHGTVEDWCPFLESHYLSLQKISEIPSPRVIKSHLPYNMLPADLEKLPVKVIYVVRNIRDVCVSAYDFFRMMRYFKLDVSCQEFVGIFSSGKVPFGPWDEHIVGYWNHRNDRTLLILSYEELHQRPVESVTKIAEFLGRQLTEEQITDIIQQTQFSVMKDDNSVNYSWLENNNLKFMRKGIVGDWRNYLSSEMVSELHEKCVRPLKTRGISFNEEDWLVP